MSYPFARLLSDVQHRYPSPKAPPTSEPAQGVMDEPGDGDFDGRMRQLPKEMGTLLVAIGVAGLLLPGPVGSPFVIAGGLVLWPKGFSKVEHWFERRFPVIHRQGMAQVDRYLGDIERRYPGSTGEVAAA